MGDLYVSEAFQECCFITVTATGLGSPGLVPTCTAIRISNNTRTVLTVQEVGNGWYRVTDLAGAIGNAEAYGTEWAVGGANTIHGPFKIYKVGGGQLQAVFDRLGAPAGASLAADLLVIDNFVDGIEADIGVFPTANYATLAAYVEDIRTRLIAIVSQNSELFGSVMQEEVQLGAGAADVNMPSVDLPDIAGTIDRAYLHFKVRMIENTHDGLNELAGAQSIRIKKAAGAWGADDVLAVTFLDGGIELAALTREAGDVFGGKIDVSSEVDAFNATYNIRWEDGAVDQDFINFNDIEMFLRVVFH